MEELTENSVINTLKECQMCHQVLPKSEFYKRKDRNGEFGWIASYCKKCEVEKVKETREKNPEHYNKYNREYLNEYYYNNKDKYEIYYKRYYYNKLSYEKQIKYREKLQEKYPDIVNLICN